MAKYGDLYSGNFLKATDLRQPYTPCVVDSVGVKPIKQQNGPDRQMVVVGFRGSDKELVLNVTNYNTLLELLGDDEDQWVGHGINLWKTKTEYGGRMVDAIRIVSAEQAAPPPTIPANPGPPAGGNDDIPF